MMTHRQVHMRRQINPTEPGYREAVTAAAFMIYRSLLTFDIAACNVVADSVPCLACLMQAVAQVGLALARHGETAEQAMTIDIAAVLDRLEPVMLQLAHGETAVVTIPPTAKE